MWTYKHSQILRCLTLALSFISSYSSTSMGHKQKSNAAIAFNRGMTSSQSNGSRRRNHPRSPNGDVPRGIKEINVAPILEHSQPGINLNGKLTVSRAIGMTGAMVHSALPAIISWGVTMSLIFGGCCSNVCRSGPL